MISTYLNLSLLQPLDVLLTSGTNLSSLVIRLATTLKTRRLAKYSHAALMLSPSVTVEALPAKGIITRNLLDPSSRFGTPATVAPSVEGRWIDGQLHLFVELLDTAEAEVLRHVDLVPRGGEGVISARPDPIQARYDAIERLADYYALQYSLFGRLPGAIVRLPDRVEDVLVRVSQQLEREKSNPGPFCSELVCILMDDTFTLSGEGEGARVAPAELAFASEVLVPVDNAVRRCSAKELPGTAISADLLTELRRFLRFPATQSSTTTAEILAHFPTFQKIALDQNPQSQIEWLETYFIERRAALQATLKEGLLRELLFDADPVWSWIGGANRCIGSCPTRRNVHRRIQKKPPVSHKCATINSCSVGTTFFDLRKNYERRFQQRLQESSRAFSSDT